MLVTEVGDGCWWQMLVTEYDGNILRFWRRQHRCSRSMSHTYVPIRVYANEFDFERLILTFLQTGTYGWSFRDGLKRVFLFAV